LEFAHFARKKQARQFAELLFAIGSPTNKNIPRVHLAIPLRRLREFLERLENTARRMSFHPEVDSNCGAFFVVTTFDLSHFPRLLPAFPVPSGASSAARSLAIARAATDSDPSSSALREQDTS